MNKAYKRNLKNFRAKSCSWMGQFNILSIQGHGIKIQGIHFVCASPQADSPI